MEPSLQRVERMKQAVGNAASNAGGCELSHEIARHPFGSPKQAEGDAKGGRRVLSA
jgi:hypothetical protein